MNTEPIELTKSKEFLIKNNIDFSLLTNDEILTKAFTLENDLKYGQNEQFMNFL